MTGDVIHHPCQVSHPEWHSSFDEDARTSTSTRRAVIEEYAQSSTLIIGTHFGGPTVGYMSSFTPTAAGDDRVAVACGLSEIWRPALTGMPSSAVVGVGER